MEGGLPLRLGGKGQPGCHHRPHGRGSPHPGWWAPGGLPTWIPRSPSCSPLLGLQGVRGGVGLRGVGPATWGVGLIHVQGCGAAGINPQVNF